MLEAGMEPIQGFKLVDRLGKGGQGEVWQAESTDGDVCAMKFIDCRNRSGTSMAKEMRVLLHLRQVRHPHIIELYDVFAVANHLVLCMELAEGNLLELQQAYYQETDGPIPAEHLVELMEQAADALDFLAGQPSVAQSGSGMQHCDVKPSNLLVVNGVLKVADFGLCMSSLARTQGNRFIGTPPYAAPELYKGKVTAHTDQYGLAVTFCELCTAGRVFVDNIHEARERPIMPVDPARLRESERAAITRALESDWMSRWENCRQFVNELRQGLDHPRKPKPRTSLSGTPAVSMTL